MRSVYALAWRNLRTHPLRSGLTALAVSLCVAMTIAADFVSTALLRTLVDAGESDLQVTHGFLVEQFEMLLKQVSYLLAGVAAFLVFNTFVMAVNQRRQEIGLLRSLGMSRRQVQGLVLVEAFLLGGAGVLAGLALGPALGWGIVATMNRLGGSILIFGTGSVSAESVLPAAGLGIGIALISALWPARAATRIVPLAALRPQMGKGPAPRKQTGPLAGAATGLILFTTLALFPPGEWAPAPWNALLAGFLVLAWLVAVGALLPAALVLAGRTVRFLLGPRSAGGRLAGDNLLRNRGRVFLTVLTLAVGPAAITGLAGFMTFAFDDLLGDSMDRAAASGTWLVFPFDLEQGLGGLAELDQLALPQEAIATVAATVEEQATVAAYRFALIPELSFLGNSYFTYVVDAEAVRNNPSVFRFSEGDRERASVQMAAGCAALVTPVVAERNDATLGDTVLISGRSGPLPCTIAGIGAGFANGSIVSSMVADEVGATAPIGLAITPHPGKDARQLERELRAVTGAEGLSLTHVADFAELQGEMVELVGMALNGMLLLAIVAAVLGVANTTMISLAERRQELGLLRAVGATRGQIRRMVLGESALMGMVAGIIGVLAGLGSVVIIVTTFGGKSWGVTDLALWPAAGRALRPALLNGLVGMVATPLLSALAARPLLRTMLRGPLVPQEQLR